MIDSTKPKKVRLFTAMELGCLAGLVSSCAPACLCSLSFHRLVYAVRRWVLSWDGPDAELSIGGLFGGTTLKLSLDMQDHLKMTDVVKTLHTLEKGWWWTLPAITLTLTFLIAVGLAVLAGIGAGLYNEIGRQRWFVLTPEVQSTKASPMVYPVNSNEEHRHAD